MIKLLAGGSEYRWIRPDGSVLMLFAALPGQMWAAPVIHADGRLDFGGDMPIMPPWVAQYRDPEGGPWIEYERRESES